MSRGSVTNSSAAIHALGLNQAADYLEMAGRLIRLKVQLLLPRHTDDEEWEDPRAALVRALLEYQQIKEIARELARLAERRALRYGRGYLPPPPDLPPLPLQVDLMDLLVAVERVVTGIPSPMLHRVIARPLNVEAAVRRVEALLAERAEFDWSELLGSHPTIVDVLSTLLAVLELARRGVCRVRQAVPLCIAGNRPVSSLTPLSQLLEAALFASNRPLTLDELEGLEPEAGPADIRTALDELREHYDFGGHAVEIVELAGGFQIITRAAFAIAVERAQAMQRQPRLSPATLETLATIAYRQPVGRAEIEEIRGVNAGGVLRTLQERGLIEVTGRSEGLVRPLHYGKTPLNLEVLGLNDLADLPRAE